MRPVKRFAGSVRKGMAQGMPKQPEMTVPKGRFAPGDATESGQEPRGQSLR